MKDMGDLSFIANSGIQLVVRKINIIPDSNRLLFHEWFDEENVKFNLELAYYLRQNQRIVKMSDLEDCDFIDGVTGELKDTENMVLSNPNISVIHEGDVQSCPDVFYMSSSDRNSKIEFLLNQWLPVPYFEVDSLGNLKLGPYNWCRCKIMPIEQDNPEEGSISAMLLLAFDTHAYYGEQKDYSECPVFESDTEMSKEFRFCNMSSKTLDFCSGKNTWVRNMLMNLVHGVTELEDIRIDERRREKRFAFLASYIWLMDYLSKNCDLPRVQVFRDRGVENVPVEMIIDIGNSRTAAILYEGDFDNMKPLALQNFTYPVNKDGELNRTEESFDMRVAFQKVDFGENLVGSTQFLWPSMVRLGTEAQQLTYQTTDLAEGDEIYSTYSSPKRYLWDAKKRKEEWRCVRTDMNGKNEVPTIEGISNFFSDNGELNKEECGYGYHYSRKTLMTLAFMEILAQTNVQINSYDYRSQKEKKSRPRYLDKIIITCPTGMSKKEQKALHDCLKDALYVLEKYYRNNDGTYVVNEVKIEPDITKANEENPVWMYDEATCSQFVYLYGLLTETYQNCSKEFFEVYGRRDGKDSLVIGSLDIGAGTSDIMICQYDYNEKNPSQVRPVPLFWDSFDKAGDDMLKVLISNVLIQGKDGILEQYLLQKGESVASIRSKFFSFFGRNQIEQSFRDKSLRRDFNLQVLIPIMYEFLRLLEHGEGEREVTYNDVFGSIPPSQPVLEKFKEVFGFELPEIVWKYNKKVVSGHIARSMDSFLETIASIMYAYGCDIILLSGRPTSLDPIKDTFLKYSPIEPDRLIRMNNYRVGDWYPFMDKSKRCINNSKSVVPVGAMIGYLASSSGAYKGFSIDVSDLAARLCPTTDYFIVNDAKVHVNNCFLTPKQKKGEIIVNSFPVYIGSKQFDLALYPVRPFYVLDINFDQIEARIKKENKGKTLTRRDLQYKTLEYREQLLRNSPLVFTILRDDDDNKEALTIESIKAENDIELSPSDFQLSIQSLNDPDCYWLDSGVFDINIGK